MALTRKHQHLKLGEVPECLSQAEFLWVHRLPSACHVGSGALSFLGSIQ